MVLNIEKINGFLEKIKFYPKMWNSLDITIVAYCKSEGEWVCLSMVFYASEKSLEPKQEIPYEIPGKLKIIHQIKEFSHKDLQFILNQMSSGSIKIGNINLITKNFETIDSIKEKRPHWQREGLVDKEGWPAFILRNYGKDDLLDTLEWAELDDFTKRHSTEPHSSFTEVALKYLGIEVYAGRRGAIYGVIPIYLKLEDVKFEKNGDLLVKIVSHNCIRPTDLRLNIELKNSSNKTGSIPIVLDTKHEVEGNFWTIRKLIPNKINAIKARLFLIFNDNIIFEGWAQQEDFQKNLVEESKIKQLLPQNEDELRDEIVIPLLTKMDFKRVEAREYHGPGEFGADILPFYKINEFGIREYYAAQIKSIKLRGGAAGGSEGNITEVLRQFDSAMSSEWRDIKEGISFYLDHFIIVALHGATQDAEKILFEWPFRRGKRHLIYLTGRDLLDLIHKYDKSESSNLSISL